MAVFALGTQIDADSPDIRDRLWEILQTNDEDDETRAEAAYGLARRGDKRCVVPIIAELRRSPGKLWIEAGGFTANRSVLRELQNLVEPDDDPTDPWVISLHRAVAKFPPQLLEE
jgi:HEAT repeat protein